jgi:hypothetical protein
LIFDLTLVVRVIMVEYLLITSMPALFIKAICLLL